MFPITRTVEKYTCDAHTAWKLLNGLFVIYKPASVSIPTLRETILRTLCRELNKMKVRPVKSQVLIEGDTTKEMNVLVKPDYRDHPLVLGPRYQISDFKMIYTHYLKKDVSGVLVCGMNRCTKLAMKVMQSRPTRSYKVKGILGQATDNCFITGRVIEKSSYKHVNRHVIDKFCASMQSSHQKKMFECCGLDMQSQAAYELAVQGPIRPPDGNMPIIYSIKCIDFIPPEFTLEIVCINETDEYLKTIVHDLGLLVRTTATCTSIQCFQYSLFDINMALLKKDWKLENILHNMRLCDQIIEQNKFMLNQDSAILVSGNNNLEEMIKNENCT